MIPQQCGDVRCDLNAICLLNVDDDWTCQCLSGYEGIGYIESGQPGCSGNYIMFQCLQYFV